MQNINMQQTWNTEHIIVYFRSKYASDLKHREKLTSNTCNINICLMWNTEKKNKSWSQIKICHRHRIQQKLQAYLKYKYAHYQAYKAKVKNRMHTITRAAISQFREKNLAAACLTGQYIYGCGSECAPSCLVPVGKKEEQICYICDSNLLRGQMSSIAIANKMALSPIPVELHELNALEWQLIAKILPFTC